MVANRIDDSEKLSLVCQLVDLATNLRQERLFVISEQTHLQELNGQVCYVMIQHGVYSADHSRNC